MQSLTTIEKIATGPTGRLPFAVRDDADRTPADDLAMQFVLEGEADRAVATTPHQHAEAALTILRGQAMTALRVLVAEHKAAGRDVFQALLADTEIGGAIDAAIEDALNNVMRENPRP